MRLKIAIILAAIAVILLSAIAPLATAASVRPGPENLRIRTGETADVTLTLDEAPKGLAGYRMTVSLDMADAGEIVGVSFPEWAALNNASAVPGDTVNISAVDLGRSVSPGDKGIRLCTIKVRGDKPGILTVSVSCLNMDADGGDIIAATVKESTVRVLGADEAAAVSPSFTIFAVAAAFMAMAALSWRIWNKR